MKYIRHNGQWVPAHFFVRSPPAFPGIIRDTMDPLKSMASGRMHDSKSALRREYKELGYVELGNDAPRANAPYQPDPTIGDDVAEAWQMLENGYVPPPDPCISDGEFRGWETRIIE
jgi:hypothetical protein